MRLLVTGGCGFLGSNFIRYVLQHYGPEMVTNVDTLSTGRLTNIEGLAESYGDRYEFLRADVAETGKMEALMEKHQFFAVVHFAAEAAGLEGVTGLLDQARLHGVRRFLVVSRVGGPAALQGVEAAAVDAHRQNGEEVVITRATDTYGPYQGLTGMIPGIIAGALRDERVRLAGDGTQTHDWLHVEDHCAALFAALLDGEPGTIHHLATGHETRDIDLAQRILEQLGKSPDSIDFVPAGGTRSHAAAGEGGLRSAGGQDLAWKPRRALEAGLRETIDWYVRNREWWESQTSR
jgi:dTDP-glucose 4,6-dehydratase